ncbi:DUF6691 family protein [Lentilitoribacter sp. EG35]|uniref:DUF6691 family protein n=1 Tax=Lentilitoribacter sp. EG35 TaxID=3234192 RepID=UPI003460D070
MKLFSALIIGAIFGIGIAISGMANPAKVLNFFDFAGSWDPSLLFVMGGALVTTAIGYQIVFRSQSKSLLGAPFSIQVKNVIDARLLMGSASFGVGWGIAGFCPGGAIPALGLGYSQTYIFVVALVAGIAFARTVSNRALKTA